MGGRLPQQQEALVPARRGLWRPQSNTQERKANQVEHESDRAITAPAREQKHRQGEVCFASLGRCWLHQSPATGAAQGRAVKASAYLLSPRSQEVTGMPCSISSERK
jgi:hypothetical protein